MEYGSGYKVTSVPVEIVESENGLSKVTEFDEVTPATLRALLKGYNCTDDMANRVENQSSIIGTQYSPIEFFVTYNVHSFAACITNTTKDIQIGHGVGVLQQIEILDLVESLPGSIKRYGTYHYLKRVDERKKHIKTSKLRYVAPIFDTSLRYLCLSRYIQKLGDVEEERYLMVLYIPSEKA